MTVAFCNKIVAICNKKLDEFCNKLPPHFLMKYLPIHNESNIKPEHYLNPKYIFDAHAKSGVP